MTKTSKTMTNSGTSIVFFGTGPVAAESLDRLSKNFKVEAVVTKPKPAHHKGSFPVLEVADKLGLKVLTVTDKQSLTDLFNTKPVQSQLGIVIDFGIIIDQAVIDYFPLGIINSHFSLLPRWRGADPISFAILNGDEKTGVSLMLIEAGLDTGKLITQKVLKIADDDTTPTLTKKLIELSDELLRSYLPKYITGDIKPYNQPHPDRVTHSRRLNKSDGLIDWTKPAEQIEREIRAYADWPKSRTNIAGTDVIITKAYVKPSNHPPLKPGDIEVIKADKAISVECGHGCLYIEKLKPAGKNEMSVEAFINGYKVG